MPSINIENLNFEYKKDRPILKDINLDIKKSGLVCIVGPNGVGKSTLIKCINKIITPQTGQVFINGKNLNDYTFKELAKFMAYVPVSSKDQFPMTVVDTMLVGRYAHQKWKTTQSDMNVVYKALKLLNMEDLALRPFNELSAGQHQKVAIARGLAQEAKILILDEPTANLDIHHQVYITELLKGLKDRSDMIILMISHDLNIASTYADEIVVMAEPGIIYKAGKPKDVLTQDLIRQVYKVDCEVIQNRNRPHIIVHSALVDHLSC